MIPRGEIVEDFLIFRAQAVLDFSEFDALCPRPEPPVKIQRGVGRVIDKEAPAYKDALSKWGLQRFAWTVIKSLEPTEELEWEKVDLGLPSTWENYGKELEEAGLSQAEINMIIDGVLTANSMNNEKLEKARQDFLASQVVTQKS